MAITGAALLIGAAMAGTSVAGAISNNESVKKSQAAEAKQIKSKARFENKALSRSLEAYSQSLRVSAATRGVGTGGSTAALAQSAAIQSLEQAAIVRQNKKNALEASVARANSQMQSPVLQGIIGGLQGLSLGSSLFPGTGVAGLGTTTVDTLIETSVPGVPDFAFA